MTLQEAKERINELKPKIEYYTIKYYEDEQVISDFDFDTLMKELKQIEAEYPQLITTDSPTQKVGTSPIKKGFKKVTHKVPLQSLQDVFSFEEVKEFDTRMQKLAEEYNLPLEYVVETKIDGLSTAHFGVLYVVPIFSLNSKLFTLTTAPSIPKVKLSLSLPIFSIALITSFIFLHNIFTGFTLNPIFSRYSSP